MTARNTAYRSDSTPLEVKPRVYAILARAFAQEEVRTCFALLGDKVVSPTIRRPHPRPGGEKKG
jgi:hypothetical protein